jgi:uncharacterized membrane protein YeaQ/YmgE (transglycosylase-associated protein family)
MHSLALLSGLATGLVAGGIGHLFVARRAGVPRWSTPLIGVCGAFLGTVIAAVAGVPDDAGLHGVRFAMQAGSAVLAVASAVVIGRRPE